ncbi:hypothetical protein CI102_1430 [Trichoderma harzianum]|nr:hypothetical protein CI102_1430 [Trichoderma harzianum]
MHARPASNLGIPRGKHPSGWLLQHNLSAFKNTTWYTLTGSRCCRQPPYLTAYWSQVICTYAPIAQESDPFQVVSQPERRFGSSLFFFVSISFFPSFPIRIFIRTHSALLLRWEGPCMCLPATGKLATRC